jgi:hypothetical protein
MVPDHQLHDFKADFVVSCRDNFFDLGVPLPRLFHRARVASSASTSSPPAISVYATPAHAVQRYFGVLRSAKDVIRNRQM